MRIGDILGYHAVPAEFLALTPKLSARVEAELAVGRTPDVDRGVQAATRLTEHVTMRAWE